MIIRKISYPNSDYYARQRRRTHFSVVSNLSQPAVKTWNKTLRISIFAAIPILAAFLFLAWIRVTQLELGYQLATLESQRTALDHQQRMLSLEREVLKRPQRIEQLAREKLGLKRPSPSQIIRLSAP